MKNNGVNLYGISIANEPDYGHDWTWWTESEIVTFLKYYAGSINCRIIAPESFSYNKSYYNAIINEGIRGSHDIKLLNIVDHFKSRISGNLDELYDDTIKSYKADNWYTFLRSTIVNIFTVVIKIY